MNKFELLAAPFASDKISWRIGSTTKAKDKGMALAYLDARDVMDRLDEACGVDGWQALYPHVNGQGATCKIGIKCGDEWVWKENGAGATDIEAAKGALSDAFKRAAVLWGVGRYLYDMKSIWVEIEARGRSYVITAEAQKRLSKIKPNTPPPVKKEPTVEERRLAAEKYTKGLIKMVKEQYDVSALDDLISDNSPKLKRLNESNSDLYQQVMDTVIERKGAM